MMRYLVADGRTPGSRTAGRGLSQLITTVVHRLLRGRRHEDGWTCRQTEAGLARIQTYGLFFKMRVDPGIRGRVCVPAGLLSCGGLTLHAFLPQTFPSFIIATLAVFEPTLRCCSTPTPDPKVVEIFWDRSVSEGAEHHSCEHWFIRLLIISLDR